MKDSGPGMLGQALQGHSRAGDKSRQEGCTLSPVHCAFVSRRRFGHLRDRPPARLDCTWPARLGSNPLGSAARSASAAGRRSSAVVPACAAVASRAPSRERRAEPPSPSRSQCRADCRASKSCCRRRELGSDLVVACSATRYQSCPWGAAPLRSAPPSRCDLSRIDLGAVSECVCVWCQCSQCKCALVAVSVCAHPSWSDGAG